MMVSLLSSKTTSPLKGVIIWGLNFKEGEPENDSTRT
jgi:hypothetical protein